MDTALLTEQILALQNRLQALEDRQAIAQLLASYGPAVDSNRLADAAALWAEAGQYAVTGFGEHTGREALIDLLAAPHHQQLLQDGCAHILSAPSIAIDGEHATAVNYSLVLRHQAGSYQIERVAANRWQLNKVDGQWQVQQRSNALLDGSAAAQALLA
ncbi:MAG: nuclear transport factor 2 family protein [Brachymonas sp.]|jgi:hypothetical protein